MTATPGSNDAPPPLERLTNQSRALVQALDRSGLVGRRLLDFVSPGEARGGSATCRRWTRCEAKTYTRSP